MLIKKYIGQIVTEMGFVTSQQLGKALQRQKQIMEEKISHVRLQRDRLVTEARLSKDTDMAPLLGQILTEMGLVVKEQLEQALKEQEKSFDAHMSLENDKLGSVIEIGSLINSTLNLAEVLHLIMKHVNRVTNSIASTLMLLDEKTGELVFSVPSGPKADRLIDIRIPHGQGIAGWVAEQEQPVLVPNVKEDSRFYTKIDEISGFETKSILCVPLKAKTKLIGVLEVINKLDGTCFTEEDELLLSMFGYQAAVAIENARLYGEIKEQLEKSKQAEETLRESEKKYQDLYDNAPDMYFTVSPEGIVISVNQFGANHLGYAKEELIGNPVWAIVYEDDRGSVQKQVAEIFSQKLQKSELEFRKIHKDGSILWVHERTNLALDENDNPIELCIICRDLTDRKQAEEALQKSEERLRAVFEAAKKVSFIITDAQDPEPLVVEFSPGAEKTFGYSKAEMVGNPVSILHLPNDVAKFPAKHKQMREGKVGFYGETTLARKSGEKFPALFSTYPLIDEKKEMYAVLSVSIDISEQKELEAQLRQAHKMESIGTLAGGIAHEFNNILGIIIGNTELAIDDVPEWNPARDCLEEIRAASLRAKDVVRHILSFARKSANNRKPVPIIPIIRDSFKLLRASIPSTIEIHQDISCEHDTVMANPTQINQVLINLCTNATHAMREEGGVLDVNLENVVLDDVTLTQYENLSFGNHIKLTVKDTGHGIKPEIIDRIFDPYFTTKGVGEGTGMGLAVVHGIVKNHDGLITVNSELGKGTVIEVLLPIVEAETEPEVVEPDDLPTGNEKILFVDDEEPLVNIAKKMLERLGYQVETQTNPDEAFKLFRSNPDKFDLIISDMTMPQMTGDKLAQKIMEIRPDIPIIISTGFSAKMDEDKAKEMGIRAFTMKPLVPHAFAVTVRKVLDENNH